MKLSFLFDDYDEFWDEFVESEPYEGRDYQLVFIENETEYYGDQYIIHCPRLDMSFREGLMGYADEDDSEECIIVYRGNHLLAENIVGVYSDTYISALIDMIASDNGVNTADMECSIEILDTSSWSDDN